MGLFTTSFSLGPGLRAVVGYPFQLYTLSTWLVNVVDCIGGSSLIISSSSFLSRTRTSPSFFNICYEPWSIFSWALNKEIFYSRYQFWHSQLFLKSSCTDEEKSEFNISLTTWMLFSMFRVISELIILSFKLERASPKHMSYAKVWVWVISGFGLLYCKLFFRPGPVSQVGDGGILF